jgi:hypothetical protein
MPAWLIVMLMGLWATSKPLPPKKHARKIAQGCAAYAPRGATKQHLDRLIAEASGELTGPTVDQEFSAKLLGDLASDCNEIRHYLREKFGRNWKKELAS